MLVFYLKAWVVQISTQKVSGKYTMSWFIVSSIWTMLWIKDFIEQLQVYLNLLDNEGNIADVEPPAGMELHG
jgi:hypothetical protein